MKVIWGNQHAETNIKHVNDITERTADPLECVKVNKSLEISDFTF